MSETHILFTGVGRRIELLQAFRNAALVLDKKIKIYGADMARTAPALAYCDHTRRVVAIKDPTYIDSLLELCRQDQIDLLIPTIDTDLLILSENRERFEEIGTKVLIAAPDKIRICRDKNLTSQFFVDCGLKTTISDIEGASFTIDIFCDWDGRPISIVPRERLQVRTGEVLKTKITMDPMMIQRAETLCEAFRPCGPMTVQLIKDVQTGEDYYTEMTPRFGGGSPLSMKAGARSAEAALKLISGEPVECYTQIADGAIYSRFDQSICIITGPGKVLGVIFDLDDTLYAEKDYVRSGYKAVADWIGDEGCAEQLWQYFEAGQPAIDRLMESLGRQDESKQALEVYRAHQPEIKLYEGAKDLLTALRDKGMKIGIITDGRPEGQRNKIAALGLEELVDDIIITDELGGTQFRKPCDIAFRIMQTRWKLPASEMVYVGDNPAKDFQAPQQLGMRSVCISNTDSLYYEPTESDYFETVDDLKGLRDVLSRQSR